MLDYIIDYLIIFIYSIGRAIKWTIGTIIIIAFFIFCAYLWFQLLEWSTDNLRIVDNIIKNHPEQMSWTIIGKYFFFLGTSLATIAPLVMAMPKHHGIIIYRR